MKRDVIIIALGLISVGLQSCDYRKVQQEALSQIERGGETVYNQKKYVETTWAYLNDRYGRKVGKYFEKEEKESEDFSEIVGEAYIFFQDEKKVIQCFQLARPLKKEKLVQEI